MGKKIFATLDDFRDYIIVKQDLPDFVNVEGIDWEMEEYDYNGNQVIYTNVKHEKDLIINWNTSRYIDMRDIKEMYIDDKMGYRNDGFVYQTGETPIEKQMKAVARKKRKLALHKRMFENIYDLIKGGEFEEIARNELRQFIRHKNIEWDGDNCKIKLGRDFEVSLTKLG